MCPFHNRQQSISHDLYIQITAIILTPNFPGWLAPMHFNPTRFEEFLSFAITVCGTWVGASWLVGGYKANATSGEPTVAAPPFPPNSPCATYTQLPSTTAAMSLLRVQPAESAGQHAPESSVYHLGNMLTAFVFGSTCKRLSSERWPSQPQYHAHFTAF